MNPASTSASSVDVPARFFDGHTARAYPVRLRFQSGPELLVQGVGFEARYSAADVSLPAPAGDAPRFLHLPGANTCEITDLAALETALAAWPSTPRVHRRAPGWRFALAAFATLLFVAWFTISHALPFGARQAAFALPEETVLKLGADTLADLDQTLFRPSRLPQERINQLLYKSRRFLSEVGEPADRRIEFRSAPSIGPNAMALPSGVIVFTDDIVRLAQNDEQLLAVLAHECGHVHHRHSLRGVLQSSAVVMVITLVSGKQGALDTAQSALTAHIVNSGYSREFEFEADAYAAELLTRANIPPSRLGEMLDLLERHAGRGGEKSGGLDTYLQSHPATADRKERLASH